MAENWVCGQELVHIHSIPGSYCRDISRDRQSLENPFLGYFENLEGNGRELQQWLELLGHLFYVRTDRVEHPTSNIVWILFPIQ